MKRRKTGIAPGRPGKAAGHWGQAWLRKCLVFSLIAVFLAVSGVAFAAPGQVKAAAPTVFLTDGDLVRHTVWEGGTITLTYTIDNPGPGIVKVGLGATIASPQVPGPREWITDPLNNVVVDVAPGTGTYSRIFRIPDPAV